MTHPTRNLAQGLLTTLVCLLVVVLPSALSTGAVTAWHVATGPMYGGTLHVAYSGGMVSFDAAQAGSDDWSVMMGTLYNGLYQSDRTGQPQLDLAAAPPTISADRKTWTFRIRKGVHFSNGMEVTADDFKYSITRVLDPHLKPTPSWGQSTDEIFQGSQDFVNGKATSVAGIQVLDRYTIRFVLTQPVAVFPYILAESFNMVVPKAVVTKESADYFASHPVGTGPFTLQSWSKGSQVIFVRNPHYFHTGKPYVDKVIADISAEPSVIALKIEKGEVQGFGYANEVAPADVQQARGDPKYAHYLVNSPITYVTWLSLRVQVDPLTKLAIRQAVAMAINRRRLVQLLGGAALPATQLYVPVDPQYDPTLDQHPVYPYDPQKAAALLKASGYHGQPITVLFANNLTYYVSMAPGIQQDLRQIGLNVTLRGVADVSLPALRTTRTGNQIFPDGWGIDFPDAYDIYTGKMTCAANTPYSSGVASPAGYCDPTADALVTKAETLPLGAERNALLRQAQVRILQSASRVPLVFSKVPEMVSPQVGGYYYQPQFGWQFENYWLKR